MRTTTFALQKQIKVKGKQLIFSFFMLLALVLVVAPTIPHHHHGNSSMLCMKDDIPADDCCSTHHHHHHPGDDPCCSGDCLTQILKAESALTSFNPLQADHLPVFVLFIESSFKFLTEPIEQDRYVDYVYRESLYSTFITRAAGLRAPPSTVFIA